MKVLFTGATGVIGRQAVPLLIAAGHEVTAIARSGDGGAWLEQAGARPVNVDLFDREALAAAVAGKDAIVHFATAIPPHAKMAKRSSWAMNDRLRSEATGNLVDAALRHEVVGFVQESITFFYADGANRWLDEESPVEPFWDILDSALDAERHVARFAAAGGTGISLRLSSLYGPGRASAGYVDLVAKRKLPIVGHGDNYVSHLHVEDAGTAVAAALDAPAGVYNVTDDDPPMVRQAVETLARVIGAKPPRRVPGWLAKAAVGPSAELLSISHRVSNERFKKATRWTPRHGSVLEGWPEIVARSDAAA